VASPAVDISAGCACAHVDGLATDGTHAVMLRANRGVLLDAAGAIVGPPFTIMDPSAFGPSTGLASCSAVANDGSNYGALCTWRPSSGASQVHAFPISNDGSVGQSILLGEDTSAPAQVASARALGARPGGFIALYSVQPSSGTGGSAYRRLLTASGQGFMAGSPQALDSVAQPNSSGSSPFAAAYGTMTGYSIVYQAAAPGDPTGVIANLEFVTLGADGAPVSSAILNTPQTLGMLPPLGTSLGQNLLVAWTGLGVVYDASLAPSAPFALILTPAPQKTPSLAFGGDSYLAGWTETRIGSDLRSTMDGYLEHLTTAGLLTEADSTVLSTAKQLNTPTITASGSSYAITASNASDVFTNILLLRPGAAVQDLDLTNLNASGTPHYPALAGDGRGAFLAAWFRDSGIGNSASSGEYRVSSISPVGVVSPSVQVDSGVGRYAGPFVSFDGNQYVIVYSVPLQNTGASLKAVRLDAQLNLLDGGAKLLLTSQTDTFLGMDAACGRSGCLVTWVVLANGEYEVRAMRLSPSLAVLDSNPLQLTPGAALSMGTSVVWDGYRYWVAWPGNIVYPETTDVYAARVSQEGTVLDTPALPLWNHLYDSSPAAPAMTAGPPGQAMVGYRVAVTPYEVTRVRGRILGGALPLGAACTGGPQCSSGNCENGLCATSSSVTGGDADVDGANAGEGGPDAATLGNDEGTPLADGAAGSGEDSATAARDADLANADVGERGPDAATLGNDAGTTLADGGSRGGHARPPLGGDCGCRTAGGTGRPTAAWLILGAVAVVGLTARKTRRPRKREPQPASSSSCQRSRHARASMRMPSRGAPRWMARRDAVRRASEPRHDSDPPLTSP
jgi:hypothetical protein